MCACSEPRDPIELVATCREYESTGENGCDHIFTSPLLMGTGFSIDQRKRNHSTLGQSLTHTNLARFGPRMVTKLNGDVVFNDPYDNRRE